VLPKGFHRIRHYGLFASANRFVPWRFLDAGPLSVRSVSLLPASKNLHKNSHPSHCRSACGYARRCPTHSESQNAMQQVRIREAVMPSCRRELFALRNFGIGISLEEVLFP
jgi:hypothetical protein